MRAPIVSCRSLLASLLLASVTGCSAGDSTAPPPPLLPPPGPPALTGDLVVQVVPAVGGEDISVGVLVTIVGQGTSVSQTSTTVRLSGLAPGNYSIELALLNEGTLPKCRIESDSRRITAVVAGTTTSVEFRVYCPLR